MNDKLKNVRQFEIEDEDGHTIRRVRITDPEITVVEVIKLIREGNSELDDLEESKGEVYKIVNGKEIEVATWKTVYSAWGLCIENFNILYGDKDDPEDAKIAKELNRLLSEEPVEV